MRQFEFYGPGVWLGSVVVVVAKEEREAVELTREWAKSKNLNPDEFELRNVSEFTGGLIYGWDGDY